MKIRSFGKGSPAKVKKLEQEFGVKLPADYAQFLTSQDGAAVDDACFYVKDLRQEILMGCFDGVDAVIEVNQEFQDDIPENSLIIGIDAGGGFLLLVFDGENDGVWYYDHSYFFKQSSDELNTYYLCGSFSEFMKMLVPYEK